MKILIAVPSHDMVHADFTRCMMNLDKPAGTSFAMITSTLVYTARTLIANKAVEMGFDRVLWVDADMTFDPDALIRLSKDMDEHNLDMVCGIYFTRKAPIMPSIHSHIKWEVKPDGWVDTDCRCFVDYPEDSLFEIESCGFGFVMTSVPLLAKMNEIYGSPFYPLMGMGEDTTFCIRARKEGFKIWCDSRVKVGHIGLYEFNEETWRANKNDLPMQDV